VIRGNEETCPRAHPQALAFPSAGHPDNVRGGLPRRNPGLGPNPGLNVPFAGEYYKRHENGRAWSGPPFPRYGTRKKMSGTFYKRSHIGKKKGRKALWEKQADGEVWLITMATGCIKRMLKGSERA
jgi:hypothetical protein